MSRRPWLTPLIFLGALTLYVRTLAPSVAELFDDSLEFQLVGFKLAIAHPTGYPLYTLLLKLASFLPFGDVAYRANLLSAICAAVAVALVYLSVLRLTDAVLPSLVSAAAFTVSPVFWSQAVIAEVYALNAALVAAIIWRLEIRDWKLEIGSWRLEVGSWNDALLAFLLGLSLTHHRTIILLVPALAVYIWQNRKLALSAAEGSQFANRTSLISNYHLLITFLLPLTLYFYLPLRGAAGSLDGTYQNTLEGFVRWVTASGYATTFFGDNLLAKSRDAKFFLDLFLNQFGWLGLALGVVGFGALLKPIGRKQEAGGNKSRLITACCLLPTAYFLFVAFLTYLAFVLVYRVPDVEVFAIPAFLILAIAFGYGLHVILNWATRARSAALRLGAVVVLISAVGANFAPLFQSALAQNDLSRKTDVRDYGRDIMAQPFPANSTLVGILGEMTLVRYYQATEGTQTALVTIAADRDDERLAAIEHALRQAQDASGRAVFTTRPLKGLAEKYSLSAFGPLVRVWPVPQASDLPADAPRVDSIQYRTEGISQPNARVVRVQIAWQPTAPITTDLKISARLMDGEKMIAQKDDWPVRNAYHTLFWRVGELIQDAYDVPIPDDAPEKTYRVLLIVYRADSGAEVGRVDFGDFAVKR